MNKNTSAIPMSGHVRKLPVRTLADTSRRRDAELPCRVELGMGVDVWSLEPSDVIRGASQQRPKLCAHYALGMTGDAVHYPPRPPVCNGDAVRPPSTRWWGPPTFGDFGSSWGVLPYWHATGVPCAAATAGRHSIVADVSG